MPLILGTNSLQKAEVKLKRTDTQWAHYAGPNGHTVQEFRWLNVILAHQE